MKFLSRFFAAVVSLLIFVSLAFALVRDEPTPLRGAEIKGTVRARVNNGSVFFKRGTSGVSAGDFLKQKADRAEADGAEFFCDAALFQAARMMLATTGAETDDFGFICYRLKNSRAYLAAAGSAEGGCVYVESEFSGRFDSPEKGASDGLRHPETAKRVLSVEVAGGLTNIYFDESLCVEEALAFYKDSLKKGKWKSEIRRAGRVDFAG